MELAEAYSLISRAIDTGRLANGYLIVGDIRGNCSELVAMVLHHLFPNDAVQIDGNCHPDVVRLEPQGKSRTIKVERGDDDDGPGMRDGLLEPMSVTSFSGGWKVGIVVCADRMQPAAANAFLKSLEEPTPKTLYLLLTDQPDAILPTIVSRTQRVDLPLAPHLLTDEDFTEVEEAFARRDVAALAEKLKRLKDNAEDTDVALVRKSFYLTLMHFVRKLMLKDKLPRHIAFRNVEAVEAAYRRSEKYMGDEMVLSLMMDAIQFS